MKKLLAIITSIIIIVSVCPIGLFSLIVSAATEHTNGYYTYTVSNGNATITRCSTSASGFIRIPDSIDGYPVKKIGDGTYMAFQECYGITGISIPDTVIEISRYAFNNCKNVETLYIGKSVKTIGDHAFYSCESLTSISIPDSVTTLGNVAFGFCSSAKSITIGSGLNSISYSFYNCSSVETIVVSEKNNFLHSDGNCLIVTSTNSLILGSLNSIIPNYVTTIDGFSFYGLRELKSITIPDSVITIGDAAFYNVGIISLNIPKNVRKITESFFTNFSGDFQSINVDTGNKVYHSKDNCLIRTSDNCLILGSNNSVIPNYVCRIAGRAFQGSKKTSIFIPKSTTSIGEYAFLKVPLTDVYYGGDSTERNNINIEGSNTELNNAVWHYDICAPDEHVYPNFSCATKCINCDWKRTNNISHTFDGDEDLFCNLCNEEHYESWGNSGKCTWGVKGTELIVFGNGSLGDSTNNWDKKITKVIIKEGVNNIPNKAFSSCSNLCEIVIPNSVNTIGNYAFSGCVNLKSIILPDGLTKIGDGAFRNCSGLTEIIIPNSVINIGSYLFEQCTNLKTVIVGNGIATIPNYAFRYCHELKEISLPNSVTTISENVFSECKDISIWYSGNIEQKNEIVIDPSNEILNSCEWYYNICEYKNHEYKNDCDFTCEKCDWIRENVGHNYERIGNDDVCVKCQHIRLNPLFFNVGYADVVKYGDDIEKSKILVSYKNQSLREKTDYLIRYERFDNNGVVNILGLNEYDGISASLKISKSPKDISDCTVSVSNLMFTGKPLKPTVTVKLNENTLVNNKDYKVSYYNNTSVGDNTAGIIITGIGDYCGYIEKKFSITEFKPTITNSTFKSSVSITGGYLTIPGPIKSYTVTKSNGVVVESNSFDAPGRQGDTKIYFPETGTYYVTYYTQSSSSIVRMVNGSYMYVYSYTGYPTEHNSTVTYTAAASTPATINPTQLTPQFRAIDYKTMLFSVSDKNSNSNLDGLVWTSSNTDVAIINSNGILELKSAGHTMVTAKINDINAKYDLDIAPLNIASKGHILSLNSSNNACVVEYEGQILRENIDYLKEITVKGNAKELRIIGKGLFEGELKEYYYSNSDNKYCTDTISVLSLPNRLEYMIYDDLDLSGSKIIMNLEGYETELDITQDMVSGFDKSKVGKQEITVTAYSAETTFFVDVIDYTPGDVNVDDTVTDADAVYLLMYTFFPEDYPVNQDCDFNHDGSVTDADAVYLLMYTFFPEDYPIN